VPGPDDLLAERARTIDQIDALTREFDGIVEAAELVATDDEHDPEGHTIAFERQQVAALLRDARSHLRDLDDALARMAAGSYGTCESCGRPIAAERLAARPASRTCIDCAH
jgi:RNA polymerase-binding transcription factor DksA